MLDRRSSLCRHIQHVTASIASGFAAYLALHRFENHHRDSLQVGHNQICYKDIKRRRIHSSEDVCDTNAQRVRSLQVASQLHVVISLQDAGGPI
jgi:hypothetical protein